MLASTIFFLRVLVGALTRFRSFTHALISDIKKLYYQCVVRPSDQDFLRFLWYRDNDINQPIVEYKMTRLSFGLLPVQSASLYCLDRAIENNATNASPVTVLTALRYFYVGDGLFIFTSEAELIAFFKEIVPLLASRGFPLTKFFTACGALREIISAKDLSLVKTLQYKDEACLQNTLGMIWKSDSDCFKFDCSFTTESKEKVTRRRLLSIYSRIFDPLGFIRPFILKLN